MSTDRPRIAREKRTLAAMVGIYCRAHHRTAGPLCAKCREVLGYAQRRLDCCRFGAEKPTCGHCPIHCYKPSMRAETRAIMRYAGPRMLLRHPILALRHYLDGRRQSS
ncbi:MAG: nitrous oxide-stimulated promoter family protein [Pirellulales bacterium]|nr:nitrous oxide-stimulated promoter family protein [Pirellulales bacterium]